MRLADKQFPVKKVKLHTHYSLRTKLGNTASQTYIKIHNCKTTIKCQLRDIMDPNYLVLVIASGVVDIRLV